MENEALIIRLIQQDMKHHQLVAGLEHIGLNSDGIHYLQLMDIIAELMNTPKDKTGEEWYKVYLRFMNDVLNYPVNDNGKGLKILAELCYWQLVGVLAFEK